MSLLTASRTQAGRQALARELAGTVRSCRRPNEDSPWCYGTLSGGEAYAGSDDLQVLARGVQVLMLGCWTENAKYGRQFRFDSVVEQCPGDQEGVCTYLAKTARHVGIATAAKLWEKYGADAVRKLREEFADVAKAGIMDVTEAHEASDDLTKVAGLERTQIELHGLFAGRGFSKHTRTAAIERWGVLAPAKIRRDPFTLLTSQLPGCWFKRCDRLYLELGGRADRLKRQTLAGWHSIREDQSGDTWTNGAVFRAGIMANVRGAGVDSMRALTLGIRARWLRERIDPNGKKWLAEAGKASNEAQLAQHILRLSAAPGVQWPAPIDSDLVPSQLAGIGAATSGPLGLLLGTPGTGKTRCAAALVRGLAQASSITSIAVAAPTGKAGVRIQDAMNRAGLNVTASTIHKLLGVGRNGHDGKGWGFKFNADNPLTQKTLIVDESSMLDTDLACQLFAACQTGTRILLVGDPYQLPPVGHGCPLRDLIAAGLPQGLLTEVKRNAGRALKICAEIKDGRPITWSERIDLPAGENVVLVERQSAAQVLESLRQCLSGIISKGERDPIWDVQVIVSRNEDSELSREAVNAVLQSMLNPRRGDDAENQVGEYRLGDKIICLRNCQVQAVRCTSQAYPALIANWSPDRGTSWQGKDHYLANGDQGRVLCLDLAGRAMIAEFSAPKRVVKIPVGRTPVPTGDPEGGRGEDFGLAYAITGHKSQGSEWPVVIVLADPAGARVASREWWYTAISRLAEVGVVIGSGRVVAQQCRRAVLPERKTFLHELLTGEASL